MLQFIYVTLKNTYMYVWPSSVSTTHAYNNRKDSVT